MAGAGEARGTGDGAGGLDLRAWFGDIDVYLFNQWLQGRLAPGMRILDAGCGTGRNLPYFLRSGCDVYAVDADADALDYVREMAAEAAPGLPADHFRVEGVEGLTFPDAFFQAVICNAVLHFARDDHHFAAMVRQLWRVLAPGGLFFARLASRIGLTDAEAEAARGRGGMRLVDARELRAWTESLGGVWVEPLKTALLPGPGGRSMATWVLRKV